MKPKEKPKCTCKENDPYCCQIHGSCPTCVKKEEPKQIKCYCGHTTYCDCSPLEEPKQETLEEAAKEYSGIAYDRNDYEEKYYNLQGCNKYDSFIDGAKWQQERMYSEEDLRNAYRWGTTVNHGTKEHFNEWFEQFKKK